MHLESWRSCGPSSCAHYPLFSFLGRLSLSLKCKCRSSEIYPFFYLFPPQNSNICLFKLQIKIIWNLSLFWIWLRHFNFNISRIMLLGFQKSNVLFQTVDWNFTMVYTLKVKDPTWIHANLDDMKIYCNYCKKCFKKGRGSGNS